MIRLDHVSKKYVAGGRPYLALDNVSLTIKKGEFVSILGPSGSGKSTLMHIIGGLDRPTKGTVKVYKSRLAKLSDRQLAHFRNKRIGFVFQFFYLMSQNTAIENVMLPLIYAKDNFDRYGKAARILEAMGLSERLNNKPNQLSGGEQQRVAIARALVNDPDIILADEPTGNLDSKTGAQIVEMLVAQNNKGKTLVVVTHEEKIAKLADRVIRIKDGKIGRG